MTSRTSRTRSGQRYSSFDLPPDEVESRLRSCQIVQVDSDFAGLLQGAVERESRRIFDEDDEDDTDKWDLEDEPSSSPLGRALDYIASAPSSPLSSPLSSAPCSPPSSPLSSAPPSPQLPSLSLSPHVCESITRVNASKHDSVLRAPSSSVCGHKNADVSNKRKRKRPQRKRSEKANDRTKAYAKRRKLRVAAAGGEPKERPQLGVHPYAPPRHALKKLAALDAIQTAFDVADLHSAGGAFIRKKTDVAAVTSDLNAYREAGATVFPWDGSTSHALVDRNGRVFGLLPARPKDSSWMECVERCAKLVEGVKEEVKLEEREDRRGQFKTIAYGVSYGGGQTQPGNLKHSDHNQTVMDQLLSNKDMQRMQGFAQSIFATHFPDLYEEYTETLGALHEKHPTLRPIFPGCAWPAVSVNFPPDAFSSIHTDAGNKANGMCPIFSLGNFDHTKGGHLILPDLNLVIEFPAGCVIFIPSASLRHGNIPVRATESRTSWTMYAAGGLFRWVHYGFRSWKALKLHDKDRANHEELVRDARWKEAIKSFPLMSSLHVRASSW